MALGDLAEEDLTSSIQAGPVDPEVPEQMGRYLLAFEFASGGMATVYIAREAGTAGMKRAVALKCIHRHLAKKKAFVEMFLDEARVAARINHPNVCSVYDFGSAAGTYYIAMEYLLGETLSRVIRRMFRKTDRRPSPLTIAQVIADCCEGLHAAHELRSDNGETLGVVHRDVSPSNLYICYDGSVRVVDFGIAKAENKLYETRTGELKGKLAYLSPEQVDQMDVDRRADIWSLGVCLWEALTGKRLFRRRSDAQTILAVMQADIPPPSSYGTLPEGMDDVVLKALSRDPADRYQTARQLGQDLRRVVMRAGEVVGAPEVAEWMTELFPMERIRRQELVEKTMKKSQPGDITRVPPQLTGDSSKTTGVVSEIFERKEISPPIAIPLDDPQPVPPSEAIDVSLSDSWGDEEHEATVAEAVSLPDSFGDAATRPETPSQKDPFGVPLAVAAKPASKSRVPIVIVALSLLGLLGLGAFWALQSDEGAPETAAPSAPVAPAPVAEEPPPVRAPDPVAAQGTPVEAAADEVAEAEVTEAEVTEAEAEVTEAEAEAAEVEAEAEPTEVAAMDARMTPRMVARRPVATGPPGIVTIVSIGGWADVFERGRSLGRTPARLELSPGRHVLVVKPFGRNPGIRRVVRVRSGSQERVAVRVQ
ncbi:MAG: serine/threonine-protein kinase [Myxococcota bacterium]